MVVKTITITKDAYEALRSLKEPKESFSEAIMRISKRKPLRSFYGVLSKETGEKMEKAIREMRKRRNKAHRARIKHIIEELEK